MITVYDVIAEYGLIKTYIQRADADRHSDHASRFCRTGEWIKVQNRQVDRISSQKVYLDGHIVGYQFARTKMGGRVVERAVTNLRYDANGIIGEVQFLNRAVQVAFDPAGARRESRIDSFPDWISERLLD